MKLTSIFILILFLSPAYGEEIVVTANYSNDEAGQRLSEVFSEAQTLVITYESVNGTKAGRKIRKNWQEDDTGLRSFSAFMDSRLIKTLCDIKDKKKDKKEISPDQVYEACLIFLEYQKGDLKLPSCLISIFESKPESVQAIRETIQAAFKLLKSDVITSGLTSGK